MIDRKLTLMTSIAALAFSAGPALAQATPAYDWTGAYIGLHAGLMEHRNRAFDLSNIFSNPGRTYRLSTTGFTGGLQAGYAWQSGAFVYGLELDGSLASISASRQFVTPNFSPARHSTSLDHMFTARARAGYAFDHFLLYATGGFAAARIKNHMSSVSFPGFTFGDTSLRSGWVAGFGGEYAMSKNWRVRLEVLFADFGRQTYAANNYRFAFRNTATIVRGGINYAF